jgi:hypothetical protein
MSVFNNHFDLYIRAYQINILNNIDKLAVTFIILSKKIYTFIKKTSKYFFLLKYIF